MSENDYNKQNKVVEDASNNEGTLEMKCIKCGYALEEGQDFCPKCGTPQQQAFCAKCGSELSPDQDFCPKCGHKVGTHVDNTNKSSVSISKNLLAKIIPIAVIIIAIAVFAIIFNKPKVEKIELAEEKIELTENQEAEALDYIITPEKANKNKVAWSTSDENVAIIDKRGKITAISPGECSITIEAQGKTDSVDVTVISEFDNYLKEADYKNAYECAKTDEERLRVIAENAAAVQSQYSGENLKDPTSFELRQAYYKEEPGFDKVIVRSLVLMISGKNGFGANVTNYWYYTCNNEDRGWELSATLDDLSEEKYNSYDDIEESCRKILENIDKSSVNDLINEGYKLDKKSIARINEMYKEDTLSNVEWLKSATVSVNKADKGIDA